MKILHCPTDVGGNPWGLSRAERAWGLQSDMVVFDQQRFGYHNDLNLHLERYPVLIRGYKKYRFLRSVMNEYDIFHFNFGRSIIDHPFSFFFNYLDIPSLKRKGKKIFITFQGCDARLKSYCTSTYSISGCAECRVWYCNKFTDRMKIKRFKKIERYADRIFILNPDLRHSFPDAEFLPYTGIDIYEWTQTIKRNHGGTIKILHSPTSRDIKGTRYVVEACNLLKKRGYPLKLILAEHVTHDRMKELHSEADLFIDQLLVGWYGAAAVESMAMGNAVLCYLREPDIHDLSFRDKIPIVNVSPQTLADVLANLLDHPEEINRIANRSRSYVEEIHNPLKIAGNLLKLYQE